MSAAAWGELVVLVICVFLAAMASGTETALTSVNRLRVRHLAEDGSPKAVILQRLSRDPNRFLGTVLVTNTFALIVASTSATLLGTELLPQRWGLAGNAAVSFLLAIFLLIFAEITPKTLAVRNADRVALQVAGLVDRLATILKPVLWFTTIVSRALVPGRTRNGPYVTESELMTLLNVSEEQGVIEEEEREMIHGIIEIGDKLVREVMVPRTDVVAVSVDASLNEIAEKIQSQGHTRLPVYENSIDHVIGIVHAKDVLRHYARGTRDFSVTAILRPILTTPEQKKVDELLHHMRQKKAHMMLVVDEYGGTAGSVTLEDVLEEIVGEIHDEYDIVEEEPIMFVSDREVLVVARFPMDELNDLLDLGVTESEEYDSVGGYVNFALGAIPDAGATFDTGGKHWLVESVLGHRVVRVRLKSDERWPLEALISAGLATEEDLTRAEDAFN